MMITCIYISGNACRSRVIKLKTQYKSPNEAYSQNESDTVVTNDFPEESGSHNSASSQMQISPLSHTANNPYFFKLKSYNIVQESVRISGGN